MTADAVAGARTDGSAVQVKRNWLMGLTLLAIGLTAMANPAPRALSAKAAPKRAAAASVSSTSEKKALDAYSRMPLAFVRNAGQADTRIRYSAQTSGASFAFTQNEALFAFTKGKHGNQGHMLGLGFLGASKKAKLAGATQLPGKVNYLLGNDPAKWHTGLPTYGEVVYHELWPGIDLAFRGDGRALKYEFRLDAGADPSAIRLAYRGAERVSLGRNGELLLRTPLGVLPGQPAGDVSGSWRQARACREQLRA